MERALKILGIITLLMVSSCRTEKHAVETTTQTSKDSISLKEDILHEKEKDVWVKDSLFHTGVITIDTYHPEDDSLKLTERKEIKFESTKTEEKGKKEAEKKAVSKESNLSKESEKNTQIKSDSEKETTGKVWPSFVAVIGLVVILWFLYKSIK